MARCSRKSPFSQGFVLSLTVHGIKWHLSCMYHCRQARVSKLMCPTVSPLCRALRVFNMMIRFLLQYSHSNIVSLTMNQWRMMHWQTKFKVKTLISSYNICDFIHVSGSSSIFSSSNGSIDNDIWLICCWVMPPYWWLFLVWWVSM